MHNIMRDYKLEVIKGILKFDKTGKGRKIAPMRNIKQDFDLEKSISKVLVVIVNKNRRRISQRLIGVIHPWLLKYKIRCRPYNISIGKVNEKGSPVQVKGKNIDKAAPLFSKSSLELISHIFSKDQPSIFNDALALMAVDNVEQNVNNVRAGDEIPYR